MFTFDPITRPADIDVKVSDLLIATPDGTDPLLHASMHRVLRLLRDQHRMEATFVTEWNEGDRVGRPAALRTPMHFACDAADPLEMAFVVQAGNVRANASCYLSAPVVLADGDVYGTLYSYSFSEDEGLQHRELATLALTAQLASRLIDAQPLARAVQ